MLSEVLVVVMEGLLVVMEDLLERLERLSSISTSELVAELTVDTDPLLLPPPLLQSLISDFLNQGNVKTEDNRNMSSRGLSLSNWLTIMSSSSPT